MTLPSLESLYGKYGDELRAVARTLRPLYHRMQRAGHGATLGDVEAEALYLLVRETRPELAFEISPDSGWSTNYLLAALTANGKGVLHSFEIRDRVGGQPTERVIRGNQCPEWDQGRLVVHLGDARTTIGEVDGQVDFLFLDSCHEDWFAAWYVERLFPRVRGPVVIQDIAFTDRLEASSEAAYVWRWAAEQGIALTRVGDVEAGLATVGLRAGYAERRALRSNAVCFALPADARGTLPAFVTGPEELVEQARGARARGDAVTAERLLGEAAAAALREPARVNRHRVLLQAGTEYARMGERDEARRCFQRALGLVVQADAQQRRKGLREVLRRAVATRHWSLALQTAAVGALDVAMWRRPRGELRAGRRG